jgi:hypothetical protein
MPLKPARIEYNVSVYLMFCGAPPFGGINSAEQNMGGGFCIKAVTRYTLLADVFLFFSGDSWLF